jgi:hypothetical protein
LSEEKQRELTKYNSTIQGSIEEENIYNNIRTGLQLNDTHNTVVINGWKYQVTKKILKGEFDFLIVSEPLKTIFHIEVKKSYSETSCKEAAEQLERGLKLFQETIPFPEVEHWTYVRMMYFGFDNQQQPFKNSNGWCRCKNFVLGPSEDIWTDILKTVGKPALANPSKNTYLNVLKFLLYEMHKQECGATTEQLIKETRKTSEAMTTMDNIFFWSKDQLKVIKATKDAKRVAFTSEFGTGKTCLLKAKANEIIQEIKRKKYMERSKEVKKSNPKEEAKNSNLIKEEIEIVFVIFEGANIDSNLKLSIEKEFQKFSAFVKVVGIQGIKGKTVILQ